MYQLEMYAVRIDPLTLFMTFTLTLYLLWMINVSIS